MPCRRWSVERRDSIRHNGVSRPIRRSSWGLRAGGGRLPQAIRDQLPSFRVLDGLVIQFGDVEYVIGLLAGGGDLGIVDLDPAVHQHDADP